MVERLLLMIATLQFSDACGLPAPGFALRV
jgi:hypothetical protein